MYFLANVPFGSLCKALHNKPFPPKDEQKIIAEYLDTKEQEILSIKATLSQQISTLLAYRKSLIHECVTGHRHITKEDVSRIKSMNTQY